MENLNKNSCPLPTETRRAGGFLITDRALSWCNFPSGAEILDLGCGNGATVNYVTHHYDFKITGLDRNVTEQSADSKLIKGSADAIPFNDLQLDGIMMECSFSMMNEPLAVLKECHRVLKDNGRLILSDVYARGEAARLEGFLSRVDTAETTFNMLIHNGFIPVLFEDYSSHLKKKWGQMIFESGADQFYINIGADMEIMKRVKCGYFLIISEKNSDL